jgi:hypothetical protein
VRATAWHNGGAATDAAGYGIKFSKGDRDRHFRKEWSEVVIEVGDLEATVALTSSFWRSCSELRSAGTGRWLLETGEAPWPHGQPPGIVVHPTEANRFAVRLLKKHHLL